MRGRNAPDQPQPSPQHTSSGALVLMLLLPPLLAYGGVVAEEHDDPWRLMASARMGEPAEDPPYMLRLLTDQDPDEPLAHDTANTLRFELLWNANATPVQQAPPLMVNPALCRSGATEAIPECEADLLATTETLHILTPETQDGVYLWHSDPEETLDRDGTWRLEIRVQDQPQAAAAVFFLHVEETAPEVTLLVELMQGLFGIGVGPMGQILAFFFWIAFFLVTARFIAYAMRRTILSPYRVDPTVGRLAVRLLAGLWIVVGVALALWAVWRVNFWGGLAALGLLSVALGFGMQNTVANIMGGVNLALDKPFVIGDRVQIGETWGEVEEVGIRSTKILTTKKELVIVPNKLMDEREIWNYTMSQPELRRDIETLISYDSDPRLAEALMLEAARGHQEVLPYPRPRVFIRDFADNGVKLELRCWIAEARNVRAIGSDLRKSILEKFIASGIEIPYPYRTLQEKKDLPAPRQATAEEVAEHLPPDVRLPKLLYATAGPEPLARTARFIVRLAQSLDMQLVVLHVHPHQATTRRPEIHRIFNAFDSAASQHQVQLTTMQGRGPIIDEIKNVIAEEGIDLLVIGSSRPAFRWSPRKIADFTREIRDNVNLPVMIVPRELKVNPRTLDHYRGLIEKRAIDRGRRENENPDVDESGEDHDDADGEGGDKDKPGKTGKD